MPVFEIFEGIKICVFSNDHVLPHIHASICEHEVLISIKEANIMVGNLPKSQLRKAIKFVENNQNELLEAFYGLNPEIKKI